nr:ABC transporter family substrate-binding protein [Actinomycetota bacterium]
MARRRALATAVLLSLLAVSGAGGTPAQTPKRGGTVVIARTPALEPACLNVFVDACGDAFLLLGEVLGGAFVVTPSATFRPNLVSRVEIVSKQPFTLHYHIRPEARWSDGVPVTASDFVFTDRVIRKYRPVFSDDHRARVRSVRALDAKTVRVVLRAAYPDWRFFFERVLPRHALVGRDFGSLWKDAIDDPRTARPIGSGPFLVERFERGKQLTLVRNPRYWGPHTAYLDRLVWRFVPPADTAEALRRGEVDMIDPGPAVLQAAALELRRERAPGIRVLSVLGQSWEHFDIRIGEGGHPALKKRLVRQALAYGIDRVGIARAIGKLSGESEAALEPLDSVVFLANSPYYQPSWKGYRHRPAQARRLLEQAGCRRGEDGIYSCAGERLSLRFATAAGVERRQRTVELAQAQLRQIGVEVRPVYARPAILFDTIIPSGGFDLALFAWIPSASTSGPSDIFRCRGPVNYTGYCSRLVTRDLVQATRIIDDERRVRLLNRIDVRLAKAVPAIPLFQGTGLFAFKATIRGIVPN